MLFRSKHHEHEKKVAKTNSPFHKHDHDNKDNHSNCLLSDIIALPAQQLRNTVIDNNIDLETSNITFTFFIKFNNDFPTLFSEIAGEILIPPNEVPFIGFNPKSTQLRGPPAIV